MFSKSQTRALQEAFTHLQNRIARALRHEVGVHNVLVSVSVSDMSGNVLQTIEPEYKTASDRIGPISSSGQFANNIPLSTHAQRVAVMFEVAAYVWSMANDLDCVVSATFQDTSVFYGTTMDYVAQCFRKDGKLYIKEVVISDRS